MAVEILRSLAPLDVRRIALLRWNGPLAPDFRENSSKVLVEPLRRTRALLRRQKLTRGFANRMEQFVAGAVLVRYGAHVIYLNSVKSACYIRPAVLLRRPVVLHVHELEPLASQTLARFRLGKLYPRVRLIACSDEVRDNLSEITCVNPSDISVIGSMVDLERIDCAARLRPEGIHFPDGPRPFLVGACGTADTRKGIDQWLSMASLVRDRATMLGMDVRFVWVGRPDFGALSETLRSLKLENLVQLTGELANPYPVLARFDIFTHAARQDPFPLAVLEAMVLARPIVAFDVGGVRSQLQDAGVIVSPGDVGAMASEVIRLAVDAHSRAQLGARARDRVVHLFAIDRFHEAVRTVIRELLE